MTFVVPVFPTATSYPARMNLHALLLSMLLFCSGCRAVAIAAAPERVAEPPSEATLEAEALLRDALRAGDFDGLPRVLDRLTSLAIAHPRDGRVHLAVGMAHLWALSERARTAAVAGVTDHAVLARHWLESARALSPGDARIPAWSAATQLTLAQLTDDERRRRDGFFQLKDSVAAWPEFNAFSASYTLSRLPGGTARYEAEVVQPMFRALELCFGGGDTWPERRANLERTLAQGPGANPAKRVCFNSERVPHNVEGFFMHFGDALARGGRPEDAREAWRLASASPTYAAWAFRETLEAHVAAAEARTAELAAAPDAQGMMVNSTRACTACHQR